MIPNIRLEDDLLYGDIKLEKWEKRFNKSLDLELMLGLGEYEEDFTGYEIGYNYIVDNQDLLLEKILQSIFENYYTWKDEIKDCFEDDEQDYVEEIMPNISNYNELLTLIEPNTIIIHNIKKDGMPYIGISFFSSWDEEHGISFMMYKDRIIDVGMDSATLEYLAEEDAKQ